MSLKYKTILMTAFKHVVASFL